MGHLFLVDSATLARSAFVLADIPLPIVEAGGIRRWVLEQPLPLAIVLAVVGVLVFFMRRSQGRERQGLKAGALLLLAAGIVMGVGTAIVTEAEKLKSLTRDLVAATAAARTDTVAPLLADDARAMPFGYTKDVMLSKMEQYLGNAYKVKSHSIGSLRAAISGASVARTQFRVHVTLDGGLYNGPVGSWWLIEWRREPGGWRVSTIEMQQLDFAEVGSLRP